jgi:hypothetical protein
MNAARDDRMLVDTARRDDRPRSHPVPSPMKKGTLSLAIALLAAGCVTAPVSSLTTSANSVGGTYSCALRELTRLNYVLLGADRDAGFIRAERKTSGGVLSVLGGADFYSEISVTVLPATTGSGSQLRVHSTMAKDEGRGRTTRDMHNTGPAKKDADLLHAACGSAS